MDFFQHRYYKLTKTLMTIVGQWPHQSTRARRGLLAIIIFMGVTQIGPIISALVKYRDDPKIVLDCVMIIALIACAVTKLISFVWHSRTVSIFTRYDTVVIGTLKLINRIRTDWQVWSGDREVYILHEYAEQGNMTIMLYTAMMYSSLFVFMTQPVISKIIDVLLMNGTEPGKFPFPVEYSYINAEKYYFYLIMYSCVCACMMCTLSIASDVVLVIYVQHGCGIFAALGQKLERIGNNVTSAETEETRCALEKRDVVDVASCINRHNDAIEYANLIEVIYAWTFFCLIGLGMIQGSAIGLQVLMSIRKNDFKTAVTLVAIASTGPVLFAIMSYLSQLLMDHSSNIRFHIHNSQWYRVSPKAQKLLQLMTLRCSIPCQLTVGKFFIMCMRTFAVTVRTTVSYFSIVCSLQ